MNSRIHGRLDSGVDVIGSRMIITGGCHEAEADDYSGYSIGPELGDDVQLSVPAGVNDKDDEEKKLYQQCLDDNPNYFRNGPPSGILLRVVRIYQFYVLIS